MAFDIKNLTRTSADIVEGAVKRYDYLSTDTVTSAGYFPADCGLKAGDIVTKVAITKNSSGVITAEAQTAYYIVVSTAGVLTATAFA